ncbi:MAG: hypothetical protein AB1689_07405 [Thermodesulfobacteriota bacterium]
MRRPSPAEEPGRACAPGVRPTGARGRGRARGRDERGAALLGSILVLALVASVSGATLWLVRSELWVAGSGRAHQQARYGAEAGVWHALAVLAPGTDFAELLAGTGGLSDPADPGPLPLGGGGFVFFPGPPFGYGVTVAADAAERVRLRSTATAVRGAQRVVLATVGREALPYAPAALVATSGALTIAPALEGLAPEAGGIAVDAAQPAGGAQAAVAASTVDLAELARATLAGAGATLAGASLRGRARPFAVAPFALATGLPEQDPSVLASAHGTAGAPAALVVAAGAAPGLSGHGVVLARGALELQGAVDWQGVLYVAGELRISGAPCRITGMVWAERVSFAAGCTLRFGWPEIQAADSVQRLPRRPTLLALDDA